MFHWSPDVPCLLKYRWSSSTELETAEDDWVRPACHSGAARGHWIGKKIKKIKQNLQTIKRQHQHLAVAVFAGITVFLSEEPGNANPMIKTCTRKGMAVRFLFIYSFQIVLFLWLVLCFGVFLFWLKLTFNQSAYTVCKASSLYAIRWYLLEDCTICVG